MATIIIPAHNEESTITNMLARLLDGLALAEVRVIVVCNGCTDRTADAARRFEGAVEVIEIEPASKTAAINEGEARAEDFPRIYVDADIQLSGASAMKVIRTLSEPGVLAAEPRPIFDTSASSPLVRAYYAVWLALHGGAPGDVGCGLYAVSEAGRSRFGSLPRIIADDAYVRAWFRDGEIIEVADAYAVVRAPRTMVDLIKIKTRSRLGVLEVRRRYPSLWSDSRSTTESIARKAARLPLRLWALAPIYVTAQTLTRLRARRLARDLASYRWERDESSR